MLPVKCPLEIPFPFQVFSVGQNQVVDGMAKVCEEFSTRDVHCAQNRAIVAGSPDLITRCDIKRELAHPVGLWDWKHVGMLTQAPRKNASSRSRRAHYENWFINLLAHFSVLWEPQCHSPFAMVSIDRWACVASTSCLLSSKEDPEKRL